jgi:hypothetical protein
MISDSEALWQMATIIISFIVGVGLGRITKKTIKTDIQTNPYKDLWQQAEKRVSELKGELESEDENGK